MSKKALKDKIQTAMDNISNKVSVFDDGMNIVTGVSLAHVVITTIIDDYFRSEGLQ